METKNTQRPARISPHGPVSVPWHVDPSDYFCWWLTGYRMEDDSWLPELTESDVLTVARGDDSDRSIEQATAGFAVGELAVVSANKTRSGAVLAARRDDQVAMVEAGEMAEDATGLTQWYLARIGEHVEPHDPGILGIVISFERRLS